MPSVYYVLNLDGKEAAFEERKQYLNRFGIKIKRFKAINGRQLYASEYEQIGNSSTSFVRWQRQDGSFINQGDNGFLTAGERGYLDSMHKLLSQVSVYSQGCSSSLLPILGHACINVLIIQVI